MYVYMSRLSLYSSVALGFHKVKNNSYEKDKFVLYRTIVLAFPINRAFKFSLRFILYS